MIRFLFILIFISQNLFSFSQVQFYERGNVIDFISGPGNMTYLKGDSIEKIFYENNKKRIQNLSESFTDLPIDRCHHGNLTMFIYVDSIGRTIDVDLISGSSVHKIDSSIKNMVKNFSGLWKPAIVSGNPVYFKGLLSFLLVNSKMTVEHSHYHIRTDYSISSGQGQFKHYDDNKNCDDDNFFYNEGVKAFQEKDFKKAIYNFSEALDANPYDLDGLYNLAISYLKSDKTKKACECLKSGMQYGDENAEKNYIIYCNSMK